MKTLLHRWGDKMKKVLYISNIEVPYRVRFFNELAERCDLTVLYERADSTNRNAEWAKSEGRNFKTKYLNGCKIGNEYGFDLKIIKYLFGGYDVIIIGCCNSKIQILAMFLMKLLHKRYCLNIDGELFIGKDLKSRIKSIVMRGADKYFVAGKKSSDTIRSVTHSPNVIPYWFSPLSEKELNIHRKTPNNNLNNCVLVVGQYLAVKGIDVVLDVAKKNNLIKYKLVGTGYKTEQLLKRIQEMGLCNVEVIPFLQKTDLENEYKTCLMLVLPSRQECWGLVINEAASFGTPIVSTWGAGAAIEFLADEYPQFLARPNDADDLYQKINDLIEFDEIDKYRQFLVYKSMDYTIEKSVAAHVKAFEQ